jgi:hypothetical protein
VSGPSRLEAAADDFGVGLLAVVAILTLPLVPFFAALYLLGRGVAVLLRRCGWQS